MLGALVFSTRACSWRFPHRVWLGQGLLGCLMAQSLHPAQLGPVLRQWPLFLAGTVLLIAASSALGWWLMRRQVMPGTTALWGMAPARRRPWW